MDIDSGDLHLAPSIIKNSLIGFLYPFRNPGENVLAIVFNLNIINMSHHNHLLVNSTWMLFRIYSSCLDIFLFGEHPDRMYERILGPTTHYLRLFLIIYA